MNKRINNKKIFLFCLLVLLMSCSSPIMDKKQIDKKNQIIPKHKIDSPLRINTRDMPRNVQIQQHFLAHNKQR